MKIVFSVQGSKADPYKVTFEKTDSGIKALCSCAAGKNGQSCKHRNRILKGEITDIVSSNANDVNVVTGWFRGGELDQIQRQIAEKEQSLDKLKSEIDKLKKEANKMLKGAA